MTLVNIDWNPSPTYLRWFAVLMAILLAIVAEWIESLGPPKANTQLLAFITFDLAVAVGLFGLLWPPLVNPIYRAWMVAAFPVGWLISHVLLAAVFYLVLTPIGLLLRAFGHYPLQRKFDRQAETYWIARRRDAPPRRYFRQF